MFGGLCSCPCFGEWSSDNSGTDLDPVLLVSGMGGSILHSKKKKFGFETRVWVRLLLADLEFKKKLCYLQYIIGRIEKLMEGLKVKLKAAHEASGGRKVFSKYVNKWICIACPFQGAPGCINDSLLTGLQFVEGFESFFFVSRWTMHQLLVECPSIYEMLANPEFKWKKQPEIQVWRKHSVDGEASADLELYGPIESITLFEEALRRNELNYDGQTVALPFNFEILKWAACTRQVMYDAQLPDGVCFYNIYGTSFDTPFDVCYGSETSPIEDLSEICHSMPQYSYVDGDGTVPAESAKADGFAAVERVGVPASHRGLLLDKTVFKYIQKWLGVDPKVSKQYLKSSRVVDASN
ncbi:hypothetical protein FH972_006232 [Carpinus fangiana]|uniref:Phospholipase A(1) n=1 Tax=Carpinus fangiana TaxID=176857 RepID=A0A5N6QU22_9ROSI|nr:hypothetical protein FH972_006232 [Carpinus fangiana]